MRKLTGMTGHLFIFGYGYVAAALTGRLRAKGWRVSASARRPDKAGALTAGGIEAHIFGPRGLTDVASVFADVTHVLATAAPDADDAVSKKSKKKKKRAQKAAAVDRARNGELA